MTCDLSLFKIFQSYKDDVSVIIEDYVHWNPILRLERFPPPAGIEPNSNSSLHLGLQGHEALNRSSEYAGQSQTFNFEI